MRLGRKPKTELLRRYPLVKMKRWAKLKSLVEVNVSANLGANASRKVDAGLGASRSPCANVRAGSVGASLGGIRSISYVFNALYTLEDLEPCAL